MEQSGRQACVERWRCVAYMVVLVMFWSEAAAQIRYSISEEVKEGSVVGNIAKDLGIDRVTLKEREYRIVGSSTEPLFHLNKDDGMLYVSRKVDREEICERSNACIINLKTVLENPLEIHYVAIEVLDVNDHSPVFPEKQKRLEIFESTLPGARFQLQTARDPDGSQFSVQQYRLRHNDHFRLEVKERGEDRKMPFLVLQKQLDREATREHRLLLTAIDGGKPARSGTIEIVIEVLDVNDNWPVFRQDVYSAVLNENAAPGTLVIQVNATDLDQGANGEIVYSFGKEVDLNLQKQFYLDSKTGEIKVIGEVDFEENQSYEIDIQASDKGTVPLSTDKTVIIKVIDLNDNAPEIEVTSFSKSVPEDCRTGTTVALISVNDLDSGPNGKVSCFIGEDVPFTISPSLQDNMYAIVTKSLLDREEKSFYELTVVAKDTGEPSLSSEKTITVVVSDVNDNRPQFSLSPYTFYISENNDLAAPLFSVKASDPDDSDNAHIVYHIPRDGGEGSVSLFLNINSENGEIMALKSFDFETLKTFQFQVVATDSGAPSLKKSVIITIVDLNDNAPEIEVTSFSSAIPEDSKPGTTVALISVNDDDSGVNGKVICYISEDVPFTLTPSLQENMYAIVTKSLLDREHQSKYDVTIVAKDAGEPPLSSQRTMSVTVSDVNDNSPEFSTNPYTFYVTENNIAGASLFSVSACDCDEGDNALISYHIVRNSDEHKKLTSFLNINSENGHQRHSQLGPRMSIGSTIVPGSHANTLVLPDRRRASEEVRKSVVFKDRSDIKLMTNKIREIIVHKWAGGLSKNPSSLNWPCVSFLPDLSVCLSFEENVSMLTPIYSPRPVPADNFRTEFLSQENPGCMTHIDQIVT
uniref:Protocadherin 2 alpha a 15 n=1 Tax=Acanthochromis polyacanthus TaxID=80966 RepID=A0A3Q1F260_9TELE